MTLKHDHQEAIMNSSLRVDGTEKMPEKKSVYDKERYEQIKEEVLKYRRESYRTIHKKDLNIQVSTGEFTLYFDCFFFLFI
jgi:hypothetical protein